MIKTQYGTVVKPGDFAAVRMAGDVGRAIRLGEFLNGDGFGNWEHAIFYAGDDPGLGQDLILEAEPGGADLRPFHYEPGDVLWSSDAKGLELSVSQRQMAMTIAKHFKGVPYSAADYLALAAHRLRLETVVWSTRTRRLMSLKTYVGESGHQICSQLTDSCRLELGSHLYSDKRWPGYVVPLDLANLITISL